MKKATFISSETVRQPTHWRSKDGTYVMWKVADRWSRIYSDGRVLDAFRMADTPANCSDKFEPCYGDLIITISAQG